MFIWRKLLDCCCVIPEEELISDAQYQYSTLQRETQSNDKNDAETSDDDATEFQEDIEPDCISIKLKDTGNIFSVFENEILSEHNKYRASHDSPPLKLNLVLCQYARNWAVLLGHSNSFVNRKIQIYGENLFLANGNVLHGKPVVDRWYKEIKYYNFNEPGYCIKAKNFTQLIWRGSKLLGVGVMRVNRKTWVVANYYPRGNLMKSFRKNVLPKKIEDEFSTNIEDDEKRSKGKNNEISSSSI